MPNWCLNEVTVTGSEKELKPFMDKYVSENKEGTDKIKCIDLEKILPTPKELTEVQAPNNDKKLAAKLIAKYGASDWYNFHCDKWGTKWNVSGSNYTRASGQIIMSFDSAWSPPIGAIIELSRLCPKLTFNIEYCEPSMCFAGNYTYKNGEEMNGYSTDDQNDVIFEDFGCGPEDDNGLIPEEDDNPKVNLITN
jgi:hypothetical protein